MKLFLSLLFFSNLALAQSYGSSSREFCDVAAIRSAKVGLLMCNESRNLYGKDICRGNAYKKISQDVCSPELTISFNNIFELYKMLAFIDNPANSKLYTPKQADQKAEEISALIMKEIDDAIDFAMSEIRKNEIEYYQAKANRNIESSMLLLGAIPRPISTNAMTNNATPFSTYILNGKMINCMTTGSLTTCN